MFDKIYNALIIMTRISSVGGIIFIVVGLITNMDKNLMLSIALGIILTTVAIIWLVSRICMEFYVDEESEETK